ncbi:NAD(P)/FAD-dependent oxidoreductase [Fodinicola feengrottensis]|uniref:NAD(P)/FAD-dependent oxidoreductase n=1 Tax=Fodinicola feengrottensis TaxID=435914 RepID=UPI002442D32E|nr:FAD-dependent oxidoreductase [Fodinicola feengrottensis]
MADLRAGRKRVVVIGAGFAGYHCLRTLERQLPADVAELVVVSPTDYMLYIPLLPEVAGGVLEPRQVAVPLRVKLPRTRLQLGMVTAIDLAGRHLTVVNDEGHAVELAFDHLVITSGSVTRLLSIPGVADYAKGFKSVAEAIYLRDHILRQLEYADLAETEEERTARMTFVVVGAGYTGTELVAQGQQLTKQATKKKNGEVGRPPRPAGCWSTRRPGCCPGCPSALPDQR